MSSSPSSSGRAGPTFASGPFGGGFDGELSPEDLFNMFFGGSGPMGGRFGGGPGEFPHDSGSNNNNGLLMILVKQYLRHRLDLVDSVLLVYGHTITTTKVKHEKTPNHGRSSSNSSLSSSSSPSPS